MIFIPSWELVNSSRAQTQSCPARQRMADNGGYIDFFRVRFKQDRVIDGHYTLIYISVRIMLFIPNWVVVNVPRAQTHRVAQRVQGWACSGRSLDWEGFVVRL
jgi:hypothetical protein